MHKFPLVLLVLEKLFHKYTLLRIQDHICVVAQ